MKKPSSSKRKPWIETIAASLIGLLIFLSDDLWPHASGNELSIHQWTEGLELLMLTFGLGAATWYMLRFRQQREQYLEQQIDQTRHTNWAMLGRLAGSMAHEIRNPLHNAQLLIEAMDPASNEHEAELRGRLMRNLKRIDNAVELIYLLARPIAIAEDQVVDVIQLVQEAIDESSNNYPGETILYSHPTLVTAVGNADHLRIIVNNLVRNAAKATLLLKDRQAIRINLETNERQKTWTLRMSNGGSLPEHLKDEKLPPPAGGGGLGLGLAISKQLAEHMGVELSLNQEHGQVVATLSGALSTGSNPSEHYSRGPHV